MNQITHPKTILFILFVVLSSSAPNIVDFQFSQYAVKPLAMNKQIPLDIHPNKDFEDYQFPQICRAARTFETSVLVDSDIDSPKSLDDQVAWMKRKFIDLLELAEKLKIKRDNLKGNKKQMYLDISNNNIGFLNSSMVIPPSQLNLLKKYENKLGTLNSSIADKTRELQRLVDDNFKSPQKSYLFITALDFEIQSQGLKIDYFNKIMADLNRSKENQFDEVSKKYDMYFDEIQNKFKNQNQLIGSLNEILSNSNSIFDINERISTLRNKIEIAKLMIQEKESCLNEIQDIRKNQKNQKQIKALMSNLRQKKKDIKNIGNKYCEGVAKKLEDRLRNVLLSYDITFECADGLDKIQLQKEQDEQLLRSLENQIKDIDRSIDRTSLKEKINQNHRFINEKVKQMESFKMPKYQHSREQISQLLEKAKQDLNVAQQQKKKSSNSKETRISPEDLKKIKDLVVQIKALKSTYCHEYQRYETKASQIWSKIYRFEAELKYKQKINQIYNTELQNMRDMEIQFEALKQQLLLGMN